MWKKFLFLILIIISFNNSHAWYGYYGPREYMMEESFLEILSVPCSAMFDEKKSAKKAYRLAVSNFLKINQGRSGFKKHDLDVEFGMLRRYCKQNPNQLMISYLMKRMGLGSDWSDFGKLFGNNSGTGRGAASSSYYEQSMTPNNNDPNGYNDPKAYKNNPYNGRYNNDQDQRWGNGGNSNQKKTRGNGGFLKKFDTDE